MLLQPRNLDRAHSIADYRFPTVDIRKTATTHDEEATEEDVAEIFVRINNQGTRLGQADFVLTLLSVYHGELRDRIEERSRTMSLGTVVSIDTRFAGAQDPKQRLVAAVSQIAPVRNEIAHVREIDQDRLLRASVACADVLEILKGRP